MNRSLEIIDLGQCPYGDALAKQQEAHEVVASGKKDGVIFAVEHPAVITMGKNAQTQSELRTTEALLAKQHIAVVPIDRGGQATLHSPGQLVVYPVLRVSAFALTPRSYIELLEKMIIKTLAHFAIEACTNAQYPGVWVQDKKIAFVGVRIKNRITMHGLALNVSNDLSLFEAIVPCGIENCELTSVVKECPKLVGIDPEVKTVLTKFLLQALEQRFSA